ncbi:putative ubiquitin ligase [Trypanosoma theileri]|uniref:Putative ubiquitin ligase n=1 Tax=Trypanosoma theileri TaxID=67003 RepID=A0A1X0P3L5_9TRYP|nr:putative ubiquitin ligase [Trypanosoma theileri]ORC91522.1 putative ubiquitin ligase [Trypanosoma theileri]
MSRAFLERCPRRHLVIHMDINKTIIQVDSAGGRTMEDVLNSNIAANVFGTQVGEKWVPKLGPHDSGDRSDLMTFDEFVDNMHSEPPGMQELPKSEKDFIWRNISEKRRSILRTFTHEGQPGEKYKHHIDEQKAVLTSAPDCSIIPSFFKFVNVLSELNWSFTLIFRTFGNDLANVLKEWKRFVFGEHFYKPRGAILKHMKENYVPEATGCIFRENDKLFFCLGPDKAAMVCQPEGTETLPVVEILSQLSRMPSCKKVYETNFTLLHNQLLEYAAATNNIAGLVDYYPFWAQGAERRSGGKVFPVHIRPSTSLVEPLFYIFFDDNIFIGNERSIVDMRDAATGESIVDSITEEKYCVAANPYKAIVDEDYFVNSLAEKIRLQLE